MWRSQEATARPHFALLMGLLHVVTQLGSLFQVQPAWLSAARLSLALTSWFCLVFSAPVWFRFILPGMCWRKPKVLSFKDLSSYLPLDLGDLWKIWGYISGWSLCSLLKWRKLMHSCRRNRRVQDMSLLWLTLSLPEVSMPPLGLLYIFLFSRT